MNKLFSTLSSAILLMAGLCLSSCSDNDDFRLTGIDGRPSALFSNGQVTASFIYSGNLFARIQYPDGRAAHFNYENGELSGIFYTPPKDVADGHAWLIFPRPETRPTKSAEVANRQEISVTGKRLNSTRMNCRSK